MFTRIFSLSYRTCCVCRKTLDRGLQSLSSEDRYFILLKKNVFIPDGARCCPGHIENNQLTTDAIDRIAPLSIQSKKFDSNDVLLLISQCQMLFEQQRRFDFDNYRSLSDEEYKILTGLSKVQFDDLSSQISISSIRHSTNQSVRTALAILLCKLRLGLSNNLLAILFQQPDKRAISRCLESARTALMNTFV